MSKSDSTETLPTLETLVIELCRVAAGRFGSSDGTTFNTAAFQSIVGDLCGQKPTGIFVVELLAKNPRVVRLAGGSHWFVLPNNMERYVERNVQCGVNEIRDCTVSNSNSNEQIRIGNRSD